MALAGRIMTGGNDRLETAKVTGTMLMVASLSFSETLKTLSLTAIFAVFMVQWYRREITTPLSLLHYGFVAMILAALTSSAFAADPVRSLQGAKDIIFYAFSFIIVSTITSGRHIRLILWSLYLSATLAALRGMYQSVVIQRPLELTTLGNQNYNAMFFVMVATSIMSMLLFSDRETKLRKIALAFFAAVTLASSVMTAMRASFLGLFTFLAALLFSKERSRVVFSFAAGVTAFTAVAVLVDMSMREKLFSIKSLVSRYEIWGHAFQCLMARPLTGIGLNHFSYRFSPDHPVEHGRVFFDAHSLYLQVASQMGLIGIVSLSLVLTGFLLAWVRFEAADGFGKALKFSALGAFLVVTVTGVFDTTLHHEHAMAFTVLAGLMFGHFGDGRKKQREAGP